MRSSRSTATAHHEAFPLEASLAHGAARPRAGARPSRSSPISSLGALAEIARRRRIAEGLTQAELARLAGVSRETVISFEAARQCAEVLGEAGQALPPRGAARGEIGFERALRLLRALGLRLSCGLESVEEAREEAPRGEAGGMGGLGGSGERGKRGEERRSAAADGPVAMAQGGSGARPEAPPASPPAAAGRFDPNGAAALRWARPSELDAKRFELEEFSAAQRGLLNRLSRRYVWWFNGDTSSGAASPLSTANNPGRVLCQAMDLGDARTREELIVAFEAPILRRALAYGLGNGWFRPESAQWWREAVGSPL